ncbi:hypothetical protein [Candidatus Contubernalis alkaliaceticus]|uniref:hypothetical protein n=1 Tax=Candidatus Contubernalis alkaliaceticus TaxID=338645 RepID=UPI001F4C2ACD|nr:hypothetical protein [Candidatus Contubernalis alkalaceticus]UNC92070.1 hypothetical protein HUE98_08155 [Candidatus Contubernalis alkalaceticus]
MKFTLKDIVFAAIVAAAMNVLSFVTVPLVVALPIPGIRLVVVAPFYGLLLALALMRIKKTGTASPFFLNRGGSALCGPGHTGVPYGQRHKREHGRRCPVVSGPCP